jgi:hypothetical protein
VLAFLNVPGKHNRQIFWLMSKKLPDLHWSHSTLPTLLPQPGKQILSLGQGEQDAFSPLPVVEYEPAEQNPLPTEELHLSRQNAPSGHIKQDLRDVVPAYLLYVPAGQEVQESDFPVPSVE